MEEVAGCGAESVRTLIDQIPMTENVRNRRTVISKQSQAFINLKASSDYDQISRQVCGRVGYTSFWVSVESNRPVKSVWVGKLLLNQTSKLVI